MSWQLIIKLIRSKSLFLWYSFTFNVVITHEIITFQDICMYKIPKDFTSTKDTYYAALSWGGGGKSGVYIRHFHSNFMRNLMNNSLTFCNYALKGFLWGTHSKKGALTFLGEQKKMKICRFWNGEFGSLLSTTSNDNEWAFLDVQLGPIIQHVQNQLDRVLFNTYDAYSVIHVLLEFERTCILYYSYFMKNTFCHIISLKSYMYESGHDVYDSMNNWMTNICMMCWNNKKLDTRLYEACD